MVEAAFYQGLFIAVRAVRRITIFIFKVDSSVCISINGLKTVNSSVLLITIIKHDATFFLISHLSNRDRDHIICKFCEMIGLFVSCKDICSLTLYIFQFQTTVIIAINVREKKLATLLTVLYLCVPHGHP